jgi:hypothetical protein
MDVVWSITVTASRPRFGAVCACEAAAVLRTRRPTLQTTRIRVLRDTNQSLVFPSATCRLPPAAYCLLPTAYFVTVNFFASIFAFTLTLSKVTSSAGFPSMDRCSRWGSMTPSTAR